MLSKAANTGILLLAKSSQAMQTNVSATAAHAAKRSRLGIIQSGFLYMYKSNVALFRAQCETFEIGYCTILVSFFQECGNRLRRIHDVILVQQA